VVDISSRPHADVNLQLTREVRSLTLKLTLMLNLQFAQAAHARGETNSSSKRSHAAVV
jgi:hypothetical protein